MRLWRWREAPRFAGAAAAVEAVCEVEVSRALDAPSGCSENRTPKVSTKPPFSRNLTLRTSSSLAVFIYTTLKNHATHVDGGGQHNNLK